MLSRRHLRTRVMQALYSWYYQDGKDSGTTEQEMFHGVDRTYDLYLTLLSFMTELSDEEDKFYIDATPKFMQKEQPVVSRFSGNIFVKWLTDDEAFKALVKKRGVSWQNDQEVVKKVFFQLRNTQEYKDYVTTAEHSEKEDIEFLTWAYKNVVLSSELLTNALEEKNIWWAESMDLVSSMVLKTIRLSNPNSKGVYTVMPALREEKEDKEFLTTLFRETIKNNAYFEKLIGEKTSNWEVDRIAQLDTILLKMALCEILNFQAIPVKVSINEYIDISKDFSTPKSRVFINGVLDSIVKDLKSAGGITKSGRGLIE